MQLLLLGTGVVTVVARNDGLGRGLEVTRGDLMQLANDARLHLPGR